MERLAAFVRKWSSKGPVSCWLGDISAEPQSRRPAAIARKAGYEPHSDEDFFQIAEITAARVLAYIQKESLAYGQRRYREGLSRDMRAMLKELGPEAQFWSNSRHSDFEPDALPNPSSFWMWNGLSDSTFDTGVIAFNQQTGFIFWVEEDD